MKNQINFPFRDDRKSCSPTRHNRRAQWARLWFTRMREVVAQAEDRTPPNRREQNQPDDWLEKK
jgi:hypothetical protein